MFILFVYKVLLLKNVIMNLKTPITYYGGKLNMLKHILPLIPEHELYTEVFFGGGAVYFAKNPVKVEVINDTNKEVINFYKVVKEDFHKFQREIDLVLHSKDHHNFASIVYNYPDYFSSIRRAWAFWVLASQSFASKLDGSWGYGRKSNSTAKRLVNKKIAFTESLMRRLEFTQIESRDAIKVLQSRDTEQAFHYIDPPYFNSDMGHYKGYSKDNFTDLLMACAKLEGKFLLSSYDSDVLAKFAKEYGWTQKRITKKLAIHSKVKRNKVEVLTANYAI